MSAPPLLPPMPAETHAVVLEPSTWRARIRAHQERVDAWIKPHLQRRRQGQRHPVEDFLFDYYPYSTGKLRRWHPGPGVVLAGSVDSVLQIPGHVVIDGRTQLTWASLPDHQRTRLAREVHAVRRLMTATASRPPRLGCFGLHEWAMVLGQSAEQVRHAGWPLRVSPTQIRTTIDEVGLSCTHFDAFRFFTDEARPRNPLVLTRASQVETDQPGCLHANMDLYKWSIRLSPLLPSEWIADAFDLARRIRHLDMQGAPYDLAALGVAPLPLETPEGRAEFARRQRAHAEEARVLRDRLLRHLNMLSLTLSDMLGDPTAQETHR